MKKNKNSIKFLKQKVWKLVSLFVRLKESDNSGNAICITCNQKLFWKDGQSGHFIDGRGNSILFDIRGIHFQCPRCNIFLHGNKLKYWVWMEENYGRNTIDELIILSKQSRKFTVSELQEMAINYTLKCSKLLKDKNG